MDKLATFTIITSRNLDHDHRHIMSLLYMPIIGLEAFSLYHTLYALIDRANLHAPTYPHNFMFDLLAINQKQFEKARQKLEAVGLLETYQKEDNYIYELYLPLSAELFIKDSIFAPYLLKNIGKNRFDELIQHFKIKRLYHKDYDAISVSFNDIFNPAYEKITTKSQYVAAKKRSVEMTHAFNVDLLIDSLPDHLTHPNTKTKTIKERLYQMAYVYNLDEETFKTLILQALHKDMSIDFDTLTKQCQTYYQAQPKNQYTKKTAGYNLDYFKSTHPKTIVEDLTGMHVPAADVKIIDKLINQTDMTIEVLNVLIAYVLKELDNQFPVYNYFEKIIAEWKRASITTAEDAIDHIKKRKAKKRQKPTTYKKASKTLPEDVKVDWFDAYLKAQEKES